MPFPSLGKTTQKRAITQASANTESDQARVIKTTTDALGNITSADVVVKGQVAPLVQVANASGLKLYVGATVEMRFLDGAKHNRQIVGIVGGSTAAALSAGTASPVPLNMASYLAGNAPVLLQSADPGDNPNGYVEAPGANVSFLDTPPSTGSGGAAVNGQRLLSVRPLVATSLPNPSLTTLPDGTLLDLVDSYGNPQGMYRLDAGAGVWRRRDAGSGAGSVGSGLVLPATSSAFGSVKTDITESGGSVVYTKTTLDSLLAGKISVGAALAESEITGLLTDLSNKITVGAALSESEITNLVSDLAGKIAAGTALPESEITGLVSDLAGKIASGTALPESEITNLAADLAARIAVVGTPADGQVPTWVASASQYQPKTPAGTGGGISITESIGNGADLALSTAYQTVPTISISLGANAAVDADALIEIVADAAAGYDDLFFQLFDTVAAAAIPFSERHVSHIAAGKRGQIALSKYVAGTPAGRTLVLQAKNGTAARGTLNTNRSLLQTLGVGSGTSSGGGITSPTQVSGLAVWLNAGAITGTANGAALASWADASGNGHNATQATAGSQPLYIASGLNGKPVVRFNGTSQFMTLGDLSAALPAAASLFIVATYNGTQNQVLYSTSPYNSSTQAGDDFSYFQSNGGSYWSVFTTPRTPTYGGTMPSTGSNLFSLVSGPSAWELWVNQVDKGAVSSTFAPGTNHLLGHSNNAANAVYLSGDISELLIYSAALSTTDRQNVEGYLKSKYGI